MPIDRNEEDERAARIDALLAEARAKIQAAREHGKQTKPQPRKAQGPAKARLDAARHGRPRKKPA